MRIKKMLLLALGVGLTISGCSQETTDDGYGSASVAALTTSDVDRVEVTIDGTSFAATLARDGVSGNFEPVVINDIPIGSYTFRAEAYDDTTTPGTPILLYTGTVDATITDGVQTAVTILLQQVPPVDPFVNTVPIFQSLVYTPANPTTGQVVTLTVSVVDPDLGDVLTLLWSAPSGTLTPPLDQPSVDWTAPSTDGTYPVTITASDLSGATSTLTANIPVAVPVGSAEVTIDLNTWPEVSNLVPDPTRIINVSESTSLTLTAIDPDGDDLAYAWSATGCAGTFSDATAAPDFTLTDAQGGTECTLSVTVTDVDTVTALPRGGSNTADVTIATGPEVQANASECPCWDGGPDSAGTSLQDVWLSALAPPDCALENSCGNDLSRGISNTLQISDAECRDTSGDFLFTTLVEERSSAVGGTVFKFCRIIVFDFVNPPGVTLADVDLTDEELAICLAEHRDFIGSADPNYVNFACGLPSP